MLAQECASICFATGKVSGVSGQVTGKTLPDI